MKVSTDSNHLSNPPGQDSAGSPHPTWRGTSFSLGLGLGFGLAIVLVISATIASITAIAITVVTVASRLR